MRSREFIKLLGGTGMGQAYPSKRCGHCGMPLVQTTAPAITMVREL